jgi:DNA-binding CsgD family transcriptional regulator
MNSIAQRNKEVTSSNFIVETLYEAAWQPGRWAHALNALADHLGGLDVQILVNDHSSGPYILGRPRRLSLEAQTEYVRCWIAEDPRPPLADQLPLYEMLSCHDHFDDQCVRNSRFFQEFLIPDGGRFLTGGRIVDMATTTAYVGVHRNANQGPLPSEDVRLLRDVAREIGRAVRFHLEFEELRTKNAVLSAVLDFLPAIACVTDSRCRLVPGSRRAERLFAMNDGLGVRAGIVTPSRADDETMLRRLVEQATASRSGKCGGAFGLVRPSDGTRLRLEVMPLAASLPECGEWQRNLAVLLIEDIRPISLPSGRRLQEIFGLTAAEARLAVDLAAGKRPDAIARERGVRMPTVRSQIRAVLQKTGTSRQSELVGLLARLPSR